MKRLKNSLIFKIGAVVLLVEFLVLTSLGLFYTETFSREVDRHLEDNAQLPGQLMNRQLLRYESVGDSSVMHDLVGREFADGMVIGADGRVYYAYKPELVGKSIFDIAGLVPDLLDTTTPTLRHDKNAIISVTPLTAYDGAKPFFHVYIKANSGENLARKRKITAMFILGSAICIILTSLAIIGYSRSRVTNPLEELTGIADGLRHGDLDIDIPIQRKDEIGILAESFNAMRHAIKQKIDELEQANLTLEDREGRLEALIEAFPDRIVLFDWEGRFIDVYAGNQDHFILKDTDLIGNTLHDVHAKNLADRALDVIRKTITTGRSQEMEYLMERKGGVAWLESRTSRVGDENGTAGKVIWVARDITYRKEMEKRLLGAKEEAERVSTRLRELDKTKSTLVSSVSHELRTPLTSLLGFSKLILKNFSKNFWPLAKGDYKLLTKGSQIVENLNILIHEGDRLSRLINDVLDLNKIEMGYTEWREEKINPAELLNRAANAASGQFDNHPGLELVTTVDETLPDLALDSDRMLQVLLNLLTNAAKFTERGTVTLSASSPATGLVRFQVTDTGPGIPQEEQDRIFDIFHQVSGLDPADNKPKGAGLGLAICREIVEHHNGTIWVESEKDQGSSFIVELPVS